MKTHHKIKAEKQAKTNALMDGCKIFFAFSDQQFMENKTELQEGEKYVSIGGGGYLPKSQLQKFQNGMKTIDSWAKSETKK